ncbi:MAG: phosphate acyltransferase [Acidimicrobiia bacterium]|nr:phosphate acyltransferase [Acidimicrobiia bacterium]
MARSKLPAIAVDAAGGDHAPREVVRGAILAAVELGTPILLVGPAATLPAARRLPEQVRVVGSGPALTMADPPIRVLRRRKDASILVAFEQVRLGRAAAVVSAGPTGATVAAAAMVAGRLPSVKRPAIASVIPAPDGPGRILVDSGATPDCRPEHLVGFARLGVEHARLHLGIPTPRVGLLNVGTEPDKGNETVRRAHDLLAASNLDFCGNVEGYDLFDGPADVIVADGFSGNIALKSAEAGYRRALRSMPAPNGAAEEANPLADRVGGSVLLGVEGTVVVAHGAANAEAVRNAVRLATRLVAEGIARPQVPADAAAPLRQVAAERLAEGLRGVRRAR